MLLALYHWLASTGNTLLHSLLLGYNCNSWRVANLLTTRTKRASQIPGRKTKTNTSSITESEFWKNAGPSVFQLHLDYVENINSVWW